MRTTDRMKVYNRQFVARTATTDRVMRTTDREYVHTTVSLNKKHNESDNEMVQLTKIILKQTARHTSPNPSHNYTTSGTPACKISGYAPAGFTVKTIKSKWRS